MSERIDVQTFPIRPGMRQDQDSIDAAPGTLSEAVNVRFPVGRGAAIPRPGTRAISSDVASGSTEITGTADSIKALFGVGDAGCMVHAGNVYAWDDDSEKFNHEGTCSYSAPVRMRTALARGDDSYGGKEFAVAVSSGGHVMVAGGRGTGGVSDYAIDTADGVRQAVGTFFNNRVRLVACGGDFVAIVQSGTTLAYYVLAYSSGDWTVTGPTSIATLNSSTNHWDVAQESGSTFYIYFQSGGAVATLRKVAYPAMTVTDVTHAVTGEPPMSVFSDGTEVWLGYNNDPGVTNAVTMRIYAASNLSTVLGATIIATGVTGAGPLVIGRGREGVAGTAFGFYRIDLAAPPYTMGAVMLELTNAGTAVQQTISNLAPVSKPDSGGRVWCAHTGGLQWSAAAPLGWRYSRLMLMRFRSLALQETPVTELVCDERDGIAIAVNYLFVTPARGDSSSFVVLPECMRTSVTDTPFQLNLYEYAIVNDDPRCEVATTGNQAVISGQPTQQWGGITVGYAQRPVIIAATPSASSGGLTNATYSWCALWEWTDHLGNIHRSAPSESFTLAMGTDTMVSFTVTGCPQDMRCSETTTLGPPVVVLYRTRAGEAQLRRESTTSTSVAANTATVTIDSEVPDASLNEFLYTENAVEYNVAPACRFVRRAEDALWFGGLWDPRLIKKSRAFFPGEPVQSSDLEPWGVYLADDCRGIAYQDGLTYAFCGSAVYVISGDGPNDQGTGEFSPPRAITTEFGVKDSASILETSAGVMFLANRGFMLIPRGGGSPVFVGAGVQTDIRAGGYYTCLGSACVSSGESRTARFLMRRVSGLSTFTRVYVYDLDSQAWSYDDHTARLDACGTWPLGFAAGLADLSEDSAVYLEDTSEFSDGSGISAIASRVKLHGVRPFGVAGWGRCQTVAAVMSEPVADAVGIPVTLSVSTDNDSGQTLTRTWTITADGRKTLYRAVDCEHQQCSQVVVEWSSTRAVDAAALGPELNAIMLEVTAEKNARLLQQAER